MEKYVVKDGKKLKCGYTTGSCATAAAKAAAKMLLSGEVVESSDIVTPSGVELSLEVHDPKISKESASCAIQKQSGDDPDITNGVLIYATASYCESGVEIDGGKGVGRVTQPGLDQPVGNAAINSTPRRTITEAVEAVMEEHSYRKGIRIIISIPQGEELAKKTFNPRMGIVGGISVVGTTGIVDPMSTKALVDTIKVELSQIAAGGTQNLVIVPGNYGEKYSREVLKLNVPHMVESANYIGDTLDLAFQFGFKNILLVAHIGKLVKLGIGMTNTHSGNGDGRIETLMMCALKAGGDYETLKEISDCVTTDAVLNILKENNILEGTFAVLREKVADCLNRRTPMGVNLGFVCFTNTGGFGEILFSSDNAEELMNIWR